MRALTVLLALLLAAPLAAQQPVTAPPPVFLLLDQDQLFTRSEYGRSLIQLNESEAEALRAESNQLDQDFAAEELSLTEQRADLSPEDFRALADAFDDKVIRARAEQERKAQALASRAEARRREFFRQVGPILLQMLEETGAAAVLDVRSVLISKQDLNITAEAIKRLDARVSAPQTPQEGEDAPGESTSDEE